MRRWSELADRLAATTRTSEKTALLAEYLRSLTSDELPIAAVFLTGRPFAEGDPRAIGLGWSAVSVTVAELAGVPRSALGEAYDRFSDLGLAVADVLALAGHNPAPEGSPSLPEVAATYAAIERASGPARKSGLFRDLLVRSDPTTAKYLVKILSGELRIGLREGLVEAAIAKAFDRPLIDVKWAGMLTGDVGELATLARDDRLGAAEMELFRPLKFMLASPAEDANEILGRLGPEVWVEDKYDGIRAQLHRQGGTVRLYSRDLHDITGQFPEVAEAAVNLPWDGILDGEILGWKDGHVLPFIALQARLGRKSPSEAIRAEVPVIFVAFDALALGPGDGAPVEPLLRLPLTERRRRLDAVELPAAADGGQFARSHLVAATDVDTLEAAFSEARARRNEGLMVKDPDSGYSPGRRGLGWLKMKKALATIDCVVVGVEVGHGKRHGVLSDYTFAVRDTERERLVTIGKAYSGLTDAEIAEMTEVVRGAHDRPLRALPAGRTGDRRRGCVRRDRPLEPPPVGVLAALPADRRSPSRQVPRRDRHPRVGGGPVQRPPARSGVPRHGRRTARPGATGLAHESGCPAHVADAMLRRMLSGIGGELRTVTLTLYTDTHIVRATYATRQRRVTDILNEPDTDFIVVRDAVFDDFGTTTSPVRAEYAQLNLGAVLFAVAEDSVDAVPELRTPKVAEKALISIPPFKAVGNIHLLPERNLQESLEELVGRFLPVTDAEYWSDRVGEARQQSAMIAVNHARAQIMAPHREADPWAGLDRAGEASAVPATAPGESADTIPVVGGTAEGWPNTDFDR